jgi:hypothetical protein
MATHLIWMADRKQFFDTALFVEGTDALHGDPASLKQPSLRNADPSILRDFRAHVQQRLEQLLLIENLLAAPVAGSSK